MLPSSFKKTGLIVLVAGGLMLSACAKPQTMSPTLDQQAVAEETDYQKGLGDTPAAETKKKYSKTQLDGMVARLARHATRVRKAGMQLCTNMGRASNACIYDFKMKNENNLNAYADGKSVFVTPVMMEFAKDDNMLGMVLSHEYAHNIMAHVASKKSNMTIGMIAGMGLDILAQSQGVNTQGKLTQLGAGIAGNAYSPQFESEADYVGMYVMDMAGYDIRKASVLWREMTKNNPRGALMDSTHPSNPKRYVLLEQVKDEILLKKKNKQKLVPNFLAQK